MMEDATNDEASKAVNDTAAIKVEEPQYKDVPFDLSVLQDKSNHDGFWLVLFKKDKPVQVLWDKMDGGKFSVVVRSAIQTGLDQSEKNADTLIQFCQDWKARLAITRQERLKQPTAS